MAYDFGAKNQTHVINMTMYFQIQKDFGHFF